MIRYTTKPRAVECGDDWLETSPTRCDVIVSEDCPADTGLLDNLGNKIYRVPTRAPLGFTRRDQ